MRNMRAVSQLGERDMDWQPIETAPRDGTPVVLFLNPPLNTSDAVGYSVPGELTIVVGWAADDYGARGGRWECGFCEDGAADTEGFSSQFMIAVEATHWMPLPAPPKG